MGYPEEMCKTDEEVADEEEEEEEEEEPVRIDVGEMVQLEQPMSGQEVLSTHHLVYGEDGQVRDSRYNSDLKYDFKNVNV